MPNHRLTALTGATGLVGARVTAQLKALDVPLRLVVRNPSKLPAGETAEVRQASAYGDFEGMRSAVEGVDTLFLIPAAETADRVQ